MSDPKSLCERQTDWLATVDPKRIFKVPKQTFPIAIDPEAAPGDEAPFMRPSDWIVGLVVNGQARAYPGWVMDNYHVVNDTLGGTQVAVMHCEICCSNAVHLAQRDGKRITFGTEGLYGGTMAVYDIDTKSIWSHGMGTAITGELKGTTLPLIQSFQASWAEWCALYPDTTVMRYPYPEVHPDGRHGHGSQDTFAKPGMYEEPVSTMIHGNDERLPEHEMVISLHREAGQAALPLREIARAGGVYTAELAGDAIVTFSAGAESALTGSFIPVLNGSPMSFTQRDGVIVDHATDSVWRVDGLAIEGPLKGKQLEAFPTMTNKWHSLACFLPGVGIWSNEGDAAPVELGAAEAILAAIESSDFEVEVQHQLYTLELPEAGVEGIHLHINGDPFDLVLFEDATSADDYMLAQRHAIAGGSAVLASMPERRWKDALNVYPLPDEEIAWSALLEDAALAEALRESVESIVPECTHASATLATLLDALRSGGYTIDHIHALPRDVTPPGGINGLHLRINGDRFQAFRFEDHEAASACEYALSPHAIVAGNFLLRSDPEDLYVIPYPIATIRKPDEAVSWSALLGDEAFRTALKKVGA